MLISLHFLTKNICMNINGSKAVIKVQSDQTWENRWGPLFKACTWCSRHRFFTVEISLFLYFNKELNKAKEAMKTIKGCSLFQSLANACWRLWWRKNETVTKKRRQGAKDFHGRETRVQRIVDSAAKYVVVMICWHGKARNQQAERDLLSRAKHFNSTEFIEVYLLISTERNPKIELYTVRFHPWVAVILKCCEMRSALPFTPST